LASKENGPALNQHPTKKKETIVQEKNDSLSNGRNESSVIFEETKRIPAKENKGINDYSLTSKGNEGRMEKKRSGKTLSL
jgi:hypothetical protein